VGQIVKPYHFAHSILRFKESIVYYHPNQLIMLFNAALNLIVQGYGPRAVDLLHLFQMRFQFCLPKTYWEQHDILLDWARQE
jgi:hypothetical protein